MNEDPIKSAKDLFGSKKILLNKKSLKKDKKTRRKYAPRICAICKCEFLPLAAGQIYCGSRSLKTGCSRKNSLNKKDPVRMRTRRPLPTIFRFMRSVEKEGECWAWRGEQNSNGYGFFSLYTLPRKRVMAHKYSYERYVGKIPEGYQVDHLCMNRLCVYPPHLEAVTQAENIRRQFICVKEKRAVFFNPIYERN